MILMATCCGNGDLTAMQENVHMNDRYLVIPIAQNLVTEDRSVHGVYVFDLSKSGGSNSKLDPDL